MNFLDIQNEVLAFRFNAVQRPSVKYWINTRYASIWGGSDWSFTRVAPVNLSVVASNQTPVMPADFGNVLQLFNDQGTEIEYAVPWIFEDYDQYNKKAINVSRPSLYTTIDSQVYLTPTPDINYTFQMSYLRSVCHKDLNGAIQTGLMSADTDSPAWPVEHHYLLVLGATSMGLKLENDFTWDGVEQEYQGLLEAMNDDLLPVDRAQTIQYGRDDL